MTKWGLSQESKVVAAFENQLISYNILIKDKTAWSSYYRHKKHLKKLTSFMVKKILVNKD